MMLNTAEKDVNTNKSYQYTVCASPISENDAFDDALPDVHEISFNSPFNSSLSSSK